MSETPASAAYAEDAKAASERIGREVLARLRRANALEDENTELRERLAAVEALCDDARNYGSAVPIDQVYAAARGEGGRTDDT